MSTQHPSPLKPRAVRHLVVIESSGKIPALQAALRRSPIGDVHILATGGHLYDMPKSLTDVGIDRHLREHGRLPKRNLQIQQIQQWAAKAERVLIACDADQEGDVLALDVAHLLEEVKHNNVARVRLRSLDVDGVLHAFMHPEPIRHRDAWPGTARRILDRLIGCTYGSRDIAGIDLSVGRVQSALLGAAAKEQIAFGEAQIVLKACDGREPFVATVAVHAGNVDDVKTWMEEAREFAESGKCVPFGQSRAAAQSKPWGFGEAVLAVAQATGRPIDGVTQSFQRLYESGRMSYPRSDAAAITAQGIATIQSMAQVHGVRFDADKMPAFSRQGRHAHESPRPLQSALNIASPLMVLSDDDAALSLISRHLVTCGQPHAVHTPNPEALPEWARGLKFERKVCQWLTPWAKRTVETGMRMFPKEEIALALLLRNRLGRPSTLVFHALKFASRELLNSKGLLESKGADWLAQTPEMLRDPRTSQRIEQILSASVDETQFSDPPQEMARSILESVGIWVDVQAMLERSETAASLKNLGIRPPSDASSI